MTIDNLKCIMKVAGYPYTKVWKQKIGFVYYICYKKQTGKRGGWDAKANSIEEVDYILDELVSHSILW